MKKIIKKIYHNFLNKIRFELKTNRCDILKFAFLFTHYETVNGDYLEFGVASGKTFADAYQIAKEMNLLKDMKFCAFDSFEGFPKPKGKDKIFERFKEGDKNFSLEEFKKNLRKKGVKLNKVQILKGWFEKTLNSENIKKLDLCSARIVNIDCDMYNSIKKVLEFIVPLINDGTVLLFDDWYCFRADPTKGGQAAVQEWLQKNKNICLVKYKDYGTFGQSFIVYKGIELKSYVSRII